MRAGFATNLRDLKIHEGIVADIDGHIDVSCNGKRYFLLLSVTVRVSKRSAAAEDTKSETASRILAPS
jgi:hypothetical protein